jgi:predicted DNA-binding protein with PD1-like motif
MQFRKENGCVIVHLEPGEEIISSLKNLANSLNIEGAYVSGIGTAYNVDLGYFNESTKKYDVKSYSTPLEILSITGDISKNFEETVAGDASKNLEETVIHLHGTFSDQNYAVYGGHVISAKVFATAEIFIFSTKRIDRKHSEVFNLNLFDL